MYGAIIGDIVGSPFEFDQGLKTKDFPLFEDESEFTDDSVLTIAIADALLEKRNAPEEELRQTIIDKLRKWGRTYPNAGYGGRFYDWLYTENPKPYNSLGNGSAMRVSPAGWVCSTIEETRKLAKLTAEVTHNHPEGIKAAEAVASAIFLARNGYSKEDIRKYVENNFGYDLHRTLDEIRPDYYFKVKAPESVPEAIIAFLDGEDFEDVIRGAVSIGGDTDTIACIAGSIAEAYFDQIPESFITDARERLTDEMLVVVDKFQRIMRKKKRAVPIQNFFF